MIILLASLVFAAATIVHAGSLPCMAKCPYDTTLGWPIIPHSETDTFTGTSCLYYGDCGQSQGFPYYDCGYFPNGTFESGFVIDDGEECGNGVQMCPLTTRVYCPPDWDVSCSVTCPDSDGSGDILTLSDTTVGNTTLYCAYGQTNEGSVCLYYWDTGTLAFSQVAAPTKTCPQTANVACSTATSTPTPTPTPLPEGPCVPYCPETAGRGYMFLRTETDSSAGPLCQYTTPCGDNGLGSYSCQYNEDGTINTSSSGGDSCGIPDPICSPISELICQPPGVSCSITCPFEDNGYGYILQDSDYSPEFIDCDYGFGFGVPRTFCSYSATTGVKISGDVNCQLNADVVCTTSS